MVLTEKGFKRPTYDDLLASQINRAKQLFGEEIDTSDQAVLGKYLRINVMDLSQCYELLEDIYYARFPGSARGQSLDRLCTFAGITRNPATAARIKVRFYGSVGAVIPSSFLVFGGGQNYYVDNDYTIMEDGTGIAYLNCTELGIIGNLPIGTELKIINPDPDLSRIEFLKIDTYGKDRESDTALRIRFNKSVAGAGSATIDALHGAISRVPLVDGIAIIENDTGEIVDGRPPHSFECYVLAPESQDHLIASAIFSKKPLGIKSVGEIEVQVLDEGNKPHIIRFSRTTKKEISIKLVVLVNRFWVSDGVALIKDNLIEYINNLSNGESVYVSSLYGYIHEVHGVVNVQSLMIAEKGQGYSSGNNISIADYEIARIDADHIEIEVIS